MIRQITSTLISIINIEMREVCACFDAYHLSLHPNKTSYLVFHRRKQVPLDISPLKINGNIISRVKSAKFISVRMDEQLNFRAHVDYNHKKNIKVFIHNLQNLEVHPDKGIGSNLLFFVITSYNLLHECVG